MKRSNSASDRKFSSYDHVLDYLRRVTDYERMSGIRYTPRNYNLLRMRALLDRMGHPERAFRSIHVAGTKGKGSVCLMLEAVLRRAGYRTGLYTSPHLVDMLERIRIGGVPISRRDFVSVMNRLRPALEKVHPTYFEIMTAAAFAAFERVGIDWAVVEVGLGGRLDATNVLKPDISVITDIDYDHTDVLGHTLRAIAREKAGIIKLGVPVISAHQKSAAGSVVSRAARTMRAPLFVMGRGIRVWNVRERYTRRSDRVAFDWEFRGRMFRGIRMAAAGRHQASNAGLALGAIAVLSKRGLVSVRERDIRQGLRLLKLPGRIQRFRFRPAVLVDSAHNPVSIEVLGHYLDRLSGFRRRTLIFGAAQDKDVPGMLRALLPRCDRAIFTRSNSPRAMEIDRLLSIAGALSRRPYLGAAGIRKALALARSFSRPDDLIVVAGSFYLAGEAIQALTCRPGTL